MLSGRSEEHKEIADGRSRFQPLVAVCLLDTTSLVTNQVT
jgi:hypothetical protein